MVNSKHSVKMKSTTKLVLRSSSTNINDSQAIATTQAQMKMKIPLKHFEKN